METINNAMDVYRLVSKPLADAETEQLMCLTIDAANHVKAVHYLTSGTDTAVLISAKMVARAAVCDFASAVVLVHNHPSGNVKPSRADIEQTAKVRQGLELLDIHLLDHVIVGRDSYFSFTEDKTFDIN